MIEEKASENQWKEGLKFTRTFSGILLGKFKKLKIVKKDENKSEKIKTKPIL